MNFAPTLPALPLSRNAIAAQRVREHFRYNPTPAPTARMAPNFLQANLVVLERKHAFDFLMFAMRNPLSCPIIDVCNGTYESRLAPGSDLRRDIPQYRIWRNGFMVEECLDIVEQWPADGGAAFLIGCSFTFDSLLQPYLTPFSAKCESVPMYRTNIKTVNSGVFNHGSGMVCSMRFVPEQHIQRVIDITKQIPLAHGAPIAIGTQAARDIGIIDILKPDFGVAPPPETKGVPVFWPCGVTPQVAIECAKLNAITHSPGCMFVTDVDLQDII